MSEERRGSAGAGLVLGALALLALAAVVAFREGAFPRTASYEAIGRLPPGVYFLDDAPTPDLVVVVDRDGSTDLREATRWERIVWCVENPRESWNNRR